METLSEEVFHISGWFQDQVYFFQETFFNSWNTELLNSLNLEKQGLIQAFEFTHELAWNVMKDYFFFQGQSNITGSRDAVRESFNKGLIGSGEAWMEMIKSRNQTSHTYNQRVANEIVRHIINDYHSCFLEFLDTMQAYTHRK